MIEKNLVREYYNFFSLFFDIIVYVLYDNKMNMQDKRQKENND